MIASLPVNHTTVPGSYWREVLSEHVERAGSRSSVPDLLRALSGCDAGLVEVAGWLTDEMSMGRVRPAEDDGPLARPRTFELTPGVRPFRSRR